ncbi:MAG: hypothetical protein ACR2LV_05510 [Solirubrobacteraceae bacterium]
MALKAVPIKPVEAHRLDDPRRPSGETPQRSIPAAPAAGAPESLAVSPSARRRAPARSQRRRSTEQAPPVPEQRTRAPGETEWLTNPYARGGRPHQVAVSLYVPQWERIEEQCAELRAQGVRDATVTRWLFAVLHFRAPVEREAAGQLLRRWGRHEADEDGLYFGLRKEARGVRFFEALWERQRALVAELRHAAGSGRPTLASWSTAVVELEGPKTTAQARELLRELRVLLAGDPA